MFTGIVEQTGRISVSREVLHGRRIGIVAGSMAADCKRGESVCVSGVCLTVAEANDQSFEFDVIRETLEKSTLGSKRVGDHVNLERSLRVGDRLDGHFVQGHVDGTATVQQVNNSGKEYVLRLRLEPSLMIYMIPKGSVSIDGVSLTIASVDREGISVAMIPTTLERTLFSSLAVGHRVNIETDLIARTIVHSMRETMAGGTLKIETLHRAGFV